MNLEMDEETRKKLAEFASVFFGAINMAAALAAPRYLAKADISKRPTRQQLLGLYDDFIGLGDRRDWTHDETNARLIAAARRIRAALDDWEFSLQAPKEVVMAARDLMEGMGFPEPDEGWDQWEGPEE